MISITSHEIILKKYLNPDNNPDSGSQLYFLGTTRNNNFGKQVTYLEYETFEEMALTKLNEISEYAIGKWKLNQLDIIHRIGRVNISEISLLIITSSLNTKKFSKKSLREQVFGFLSTIASELNPNELSIDVYL